MSEHLEYNYEEMASFFNERAKGYEDHMKETINSFDLYYGLVSEPIKVSDEPIEILDLGCGTGLEIRGILEKAPNAKITCIDMSGEMLKILLDNYSTNTNQITVIKDSYLTVPFEKGRYDYVVSVMTMHHFLEEDKVKLYEKIKTALKTGGKYIEGDYVVEQNKAEELLKEYNDAYEKYGLEAASLYHIDIPFSMETQKKLLMEAGFINFQLIFKEGEHTIYSVS
jgi:tRNA (cmo5U34)-methyltransferase